MDQVWRAWGPLIVTVLVLVVAVVAVGLAYRLLRRVGGHAPVVAAVARRTHQPAQVLAAVLVALLAVHITTDTGAWRGPLLHGLLLASIGTGGWLVVSLLLVAEETVFARLPDRDSERIAARRTRTQVAMLRRVAVALVVVLALGAALYTFPAVRGIGTSVLASAGLLGIVGGLAAQSTLSNLFAGMQLAFGDRLRIGDVVVVEGEYGRVEELTLGYVVVRIWDERRMVLPTSYFTTTPFVNWTRSGSSIHGTVELDVDWEIPVAQVREEFQRYLRAHPLWDGRTASLQVTAATGSLVRIWSTVSAEDAAKIWTLRCDVREHLVEWVRDRHPQALPKTRAELTGNATAAGPPPARAPQLPLEQALELPAERRPAERPPAERPLAKRRPARPA